MPYINIHEYDYTITAPHTYSENIVAVPINSTDGPSDKWITVSDYNEFIQMFGNNPNSAGSFGNSWEYAANLLLRGMSVLVRRITHELDEDGNNVKMLPGVSTARTPIKIKNVIGNESGVFIDKDIAVVDPLKTSVLDASIYGIPTVNENYFKNKTLVEGTEAKTFDNIYDLEISTINEINSSEDNKFEFKFNKSFAEVKNSNDNKIYQWIYTGSKENPHYKGLITYDNLKQINQNGYENGDFYLSSDSSLNTGHVFYYTPNFVPNEDYVTDNHNSPTNTNANPFKTSYDLTYWVDKRENGKFTLVVADRIVNAQNILEDIPNDNKVWIYSENKTTKVINPKFINGTESIKSRNTCLINGLDDVKEWVRYFKSLSDLNESNPEVATDSFAIVKVNDTYTLASYGGAGWTILENFVLANILDEQQVQFNLLRTVPFIKATDKNGDYVSIDTRFEKTDNDWRIYNSALHFVNLGEDRGYSELNSMIPYTPTIHWDICTKNGSYVEANSSNAYPKEIISNTILNVNTISIKTSLNYTSAGIELEVSKGNSTSNIIIDKDFENSRLQSGSFKFTNNGNNENVRIYDFAIQKLYNNSVEELYNSQLSILSSSGSNITLKNNSSLIFEASDGSTIIYPTIKFDEYDNAYIELEPHQSIVFKDMLSNAKFIFKVATFKNGELSEADNCLDFYVFKSNDGYYKVELSDTTNTLATVTKHYLSADISITEIAKNEDYDNLPIEDAYHNFNIFKAEYLYPGTNGNAINVRIKNSANQGLYAYVYRNNQFLERLELCSYKTELNGRIKRLDIENNKLDIWIKVLLSFGIMLESDGTPVDVARRPITSTSNFEPVIKGKYIKLYLNKKLLLDKNEIKDVKYIESLYRQNGEYINYLNANQGANPDDDHVIHEIPKCYKPLEDKYKYDVKFVSNGGYIDGIIYSSELTSLESSTANVRPIEDAMLDLAITRGDCVAYLDIPYDLPLDEVPYYFEHISTSYAAAYDPWGLIILETGTTKWMPPSFIQLYTHARSIQNGNKLYLPPAGVRRALIPELLDTNHELPSKYIKTWQDKDSAQYINPIVWINGYDYTVYGQKTLYHIISNANKYESALQDLNVRLVANEIKKLIFKTAISLTFELNNIMTWNEFKSKMEPTLSVMAGEGVLTSYSVIMGEETMTKADLNSGHIVGTVRASIARAATDWDIDFEITPNTLTVNEYEYNSAYTE